MTAKDAHSLMVQEIEWTMKRKLEYPELSLETVLSALYATRNFLDMNHAPIRMMDRTYYNTMVDFSDSSVPVIVRKTLYNGDNNNIEYDAKIVLQEDKDNVDEYLKCSYKVSREMKLAEPTESMVVTKNAIGYYFITDGNVRHMIQCQGGRHSYKLEREVESEMELDGLGAKIIIRELNRHLAIGTEFLERAYMDQPLDIPEYYRDEIRDIVSKNVENCI